MLEDDLFAFTGPSPLPPIVLGNHPQMLQAMALDNALPLRALSCLSEANV